MQVTLWARFGEDAYPSYPQSIVQKSVLWPYEMQGFLSNIVAGLGDVQANSL